MTTRKFNGLKYLENFNKKTIAPLHKIPMFQSFQTQNRWSYNIVTIAMLFLITYSTFGANPAGPLNLRVNDVVNPVGVSGSPYFGWYVSDTDINETQTAYQIAVATSEELLDAETANIWDSGKIESTRQNHVNYAGAPLLSDRKYYWKVKTWDKDGNKGDWSATAWFVCGLLENTDWGGAFWIKRDCNDEDDYTYYRKKAELKNGAIERATVYISSVHKYELYVNSKLIGKGPAYHFPQYQYYNAYDITDSVKPGMANQFAIFNHWFGGGQGRPKSERGIIMKAVIYYSDGSQVTVCTDKTWKQLKADEWVDGQPHRNRGEGVGYVERIDARKAHSKWHDINCDDLGWDIVSVIGAQPVQPWTGNLTPDLTRIVEQSLSPVSITQNKDGSYLVDIGKVYAGVPRIKFSGGNAGDVVSMLGGYCLDSEERIDTSKNQKTNLEYYAVLNGNEFVYEPAEYMGMRYFEISNSPMPITKDNFEFIARYSAMDDASSAFESSDETLNRVWKLMKHSLYTCAQEEFVDTPTREKGGFLGDAAIQSTVALDVMGERLLTRRVMKEFIQSMEQFWSDEANQGRMNAVYPNRDGGRDIPDFTQAYLVWVWNYYHATGDIDFLRDNYNKLKSIADYIYKYQDDQTGLVTKLAGGAGAYEYGIIDWPAPMRFGYELTDSRTVINGLAFADYMVIASVADALGNKADKAIYTKRATDIKDAMNKRLINDADVYIDGISSDGVKSEHASQQANMLPVALGIVPDRCRQSVLNHIKELKMSSGMVTVPWLIRAIGQSDEGKHLIELYTNDDWYGWARCLSLGATATWESWDADTSGQSMSHGWGTAGLEGYVRYILGIRPLMPQYERVLIKPLSFGDKLEQAKGKITTDRGVIGVEWKNEKNAYTITVKIPVNVTALVEIPAGTAEYPVVLYNSNPIPTTPAGRYIRIAGVGSGEHTFIRKNN